MPATRQARAGTPRVRSLPLNANATGGDANAGNSSTTNQTNNAMSTITQLTSIA